MNPKNFNNKIVQERIEKLFSEAEKMFDDYPDLSRRYVSMAQKLSTKFKVKFTPDQKRKFCKKCSAYLKAGKNSTIRLTSGKLVQKCLECGSVKRLDYRKTKAKAKAAKKS